jgi:RNA polymerase sigma-70 factor (ECF subfamily)
VIEPETLLDHRDFVRALALELVRDAATADDVAQETFVAAWQRGDEATRSPRGLLATIARNFAHQFHRRDERRRERERSAAQRERLPSVADVVEREERRRAVVAAVLALPDAERVAVLLRFYDGLAPRQIARRLGVPTETARTRVKRGVERVRAQLVAQRGDDRRALLAWLAPLATPVARTVSTAVKWGTLAAGGVVAATLAWTAATSSERARAKARANGGATPEVAAADARAPAAGALAAERAADPTNSAVTTPANDVAASAPLVETRTLAGRVVDGRSAPVVGARVLAWPDEIDEAVRLDDAALEKTRPHATTDASGHFEIRVAADVERATLFATAPGLSPGTMLSVQPGDAVTLVLEDNDSLVGTVTDGEGKPIGGARVRDWGLHGGAQIEHATTTAADGSYRLPFPSADRAAWQGDSESWGWWVEVAADGFAPRVVRRMRELDPDVKARDVRLDVTLLRGSTVHGRVVDAEGHAPIADARVELVAFEEWMGFGRHVGGNLKNPYGERVLRAVTTDEAGLFTLEHLPVRTGNAAVDGAGLPQFMHAFVLAPGYATGLGGVEITNDGASLDVNVELWRAATIVGRVVDIEGRPIAGVRVQSTEVVTRADREAGRQQRTRYEARECTDAVVRSRRLSDAQGRYEISGVPVSTTGETTVNVGVDDEYWVVKTEEGALYAGVSVAASAGGTATAPDLVVVPERSVVLEVVDEAGAPVVNARVTLLPNDASPRRTDDKGRLQWSERRYYLQSDRGNSGWQNENLRFRIQHRGFASLVTEAFTPSLDAPPLAHVVLAHGHSLHGSVVDGAQSPAARAPVRVFRRVPTNEELALVDAGKPLPDPRLLLSEGVTDSDGRFVFDDLPDGRWVVQVAPPLAWYGKRREKATSIPDVPVDGAPVTLRLESE